MYPHRQTLRCFQATTASYGNCCDRCVYSVIVHCINFYAERQSQFVCGPCWQRCSFSWKPPALEPSPASTTRVYVTHEHVLHVPSYLIFTSLLSLQHRFYAVRERERERGRILFVCRITDRCLKKGCTFTVCTLMCILQFFYLKNK